MARYDDSVGLENLSDESGRLDSAQLRNSAEQKITIADERGSETLPPEETRRLLHELRVHQVELEMQNEELRAAQQRLEGAKMRYAALYDRAPVGYFSLSEAGLILEANLTAVALLGVDRNALHGQGVSRFILSDGQDIYYSMIRNLSKTGRPQACELRMARKDGVPFWVRLDAAAAVDEEDAPGYRVVISDITERKRAEKDLVESEARLKQAERLAHLGHWDWDINANRWSWSEEVFRILGQPPNYTPSFEGFLRAIVPQDRDRVQRSIRRCLGEKGSGSVEFQIARPNRDVRTVTSTFEVSVDEAGSPVRVFGACQDVTEARWAQEESLARQKLESLGTLAGGIAHDFNNLLGSVLAQSDLALNEYREGTSPEDELKVIRAVAIRGSEIVRQLMIYAGKESEATGLVDVSLVAREMVELLRVTISKRARLEINLGQDLVAIRGSAGQIRQIVMNLVTNASEALGDRDGVIRVTTRCVSLDRTAAFSRDLAEGDYVQLEVADTGCGMSPETRVRAFDAFFTTKALGHGLGLAVVHRIVRALGGAIHLTSAPGKGTTFQILLPCAKAMSGATQPVPPTDWPGPPTTATVLIVEDEKVLREAVSKMLRKRGITTLEADNGSLAIDLLLAGDRKINVMLLDMSLPGRSSREVATTAAKAQPGMKVVLTSAYPEEMVRTALPAMGTCSFIRKPFQLMELMHTLQNVLHVEPALAERTPSSNNVLHGGR